MILFLFLNQNQRQRQTAEEFESHTEFEHEPSIKRNNNSMVKREVRKIVCLEERLEQKTEEAVAEG